MKKLSISVLLLTMIFFTKDLYAQQENDLSKFYGKVSKYISILNDKNDLNKVVFYRIGWNGKTPNTIGIQFGNFGYADWKLKFAIKDVTSKKFIVLDTVHNSFFGTEMSKANSKGIIWSGVVDNINDGFSLHVWVGDGDEIDKEPVSIKDKK